jgi:hypothetical protein
MPRQSSSLHTPATAIDNTRAPARFLGLDSAAAFNICRTLKTLAQTHLKTVIATIHQPSTEVCF